MHCLEEEHVVLHRIIQKQFGRKEIVEVSQSIYLSHPCPAEMYFKGTLITLEVSLCVAQQVKSHSDRHLAGFSLIAPTFTLTHPGRF